jgi:RNA polymerase sigma-70 factor (ECF subfamily)
MAEPPDELIPTRATLIQRLKNWQDQSSWQDFFETYWRLIYGVAVKRGLNQPEAQDVVQETMMSVAKHMPNFKYDPAIGSFKSWLLNMTHWRIVDQFRKRQISAPFEESNIAAPAEQVPTDLEKIWDEEWAKNLLEIAVEKARRRLDPKQYQIFDCYVNKAWEPERVAKAFGISANQVYIAKHRVTEAIRLEVERLQKDIM